MSAGMGSGAGNLDELTRRDVRVLADAREASEAAAEQIARWLSADQELAETRAFPPAAAEPTANATRRSLALSGGSTPESLYRTLAEPRWRVRVDWSRVDVFWSDERCVPPDHAESNYRLAVEALLGKLDDLPARAVHRIRGEDPDPARAAASYENELKATLGARDGLARRELPRAAAVLAQNAPRPQVRQSESESESGPEPVPTLDVILLGLGTDGHTASLFAGTAALEERSRCVIPSQSPKPPYQRITMTIPLINRARHVLFLVTGAQKKDVLARVLAGPTGGALPAGLVVPTHGDLTWIVDQAAASRLSAVQRSAGKNG